MIVNSKTILLNSNLSRGALSLLISRALSGQIVFDTEKDKEAFLKKIRELYSKKKTLI